MSCWDRRGGCEGAVAEGFLREPRHGIGEDGAERRERGSERCWKEVGWMKRQDSDVLPATEEG